MNTTIVGNEAELARRIGSLIGRSIARDVIADRLPHEWPGFDEQDGIQLLSVGFTSGTAAWEEAVRAGHATYLATLAQSPKRAMAPRGLMPALSVA